MIMNWLSKLKVYISKSLDLISWNSLKKIGQSKLVNLTIFVPLFGYMIFFNDYLVSLIEISISYLNKFDVNYNNTFLDNSNILFYFYFGFSLIGIASIMYKLFSPDLINEYSSMREYIEKEKDVMNRDNILSLYEKLDHDNNQEIKKVQDKILPVDIIENETLVSIMTINWEYYNTKLKIIQSIIFIFYVFGFLLVSVPSLKMFYNIMIVFFRN